MKRILPVFLLLLVLFCCSFFLLKGPDPSETPTPAEAAERLSQHYGVEILISQQAADEAPWDYSFTPETDDQVLLKALALLDEGLASYPKGMLKVLGEDCSGIHILIVKEIRGKDGGSSLNSARGLTFRDPEGGCYIALAKDRDYTLFHELCHILEDFILPRSAAWDHWELLNPPDFSYDLNFRHFENRKDSPFLSGADRAFIDSYSMTYPREDRARIMEYAMTDGNQALFASETMQKKLFTLSEGIREAFGIQDPPAPLLWEQYLKR